MIFLYHLLSLFLAVLLVPLFSLSALFSKHKWKGLAHHFGWVPAKTRQSEKTLWLHALSMGEVIAAAPVLKLLRGQNPDLYIALSVTTDSGYETAHKLDFIDSVFFHPLDCLPFTQLALCRINPDLYVVTDTGFWPGLIDLLHKKKRAGSFIQWPYLGTRGPALSSSWLPFQGNFPKIPPALYAKHQWGKSRFGSGCEPRKY
jgi:3-deoxy-D-manno-octulosonic-acid transferase